MMPGNFMEFQSGYTKTKVKIKPLDYNDCALMVIKFVSKRITGKRLI